METFGTELLYVSLLCVVVFVGFVLYTHTRTHTHTHTHTYIYTFMGTPDEINCNTFRYCILIKFNFYLAAT